MVIYGLSRLQYMIGIKIWSVFDEGKCDRPIEIANKNLEQYLELVKRNYQIYVKEIVQTLSVSTD